MGLDKNTLKNMIKKTLMEIKMNLNYPEGYIPDEGSDIRLGIMRTPAGWYVGTEIKETEIDPETGEEMWSYWSPNTRESSYFETEEEANQALKIMISKIGPRSDDQLN